MSGASVSVVTEADVSGVDATVVPLGRTSERMPFDVVIRLPDELWM